MPWHIHYSRTGFGELVTFPFFLTLAISVFLIATTRPRLWLAAGLAFGLTLYTYRAAWVTLPPLLLLLAVLYRRELLANRGLALAGLGIMALCTVPILVHVLSGQSDRSSDVSIFNLDLGFWGTVERFLQNYRSYFSVSFLFLDGDDYFVTRHYLPGFGELYYVQLPLIVLGALALAWRPTRETLLVLALLALYPLSGALTKDSPFSSRSFVGSVVFAIIAAYGLIAALDAVRGLPHRAAPLAAGALLAGVVALSLNGFATYLHRYHTQYPDVAADFYGWQYGPKQVIARFLSVEGEYDDLVLDRRFNSPRMFFKFYAPDGCGKCTVGNTEDYDATRHQLFALRPEDMPAELRYNTRDVVDYPNGEPAFYLVEILGRRPGVDDAEAAAAMRPEHVDSTFPAGEQPAPPHD
jgi:hypothetical protein